MKTVTRTIEVHKIYSATVALKEGQLVKTDLAPITVSNEKMNETKALKAVQKTYGKVNQYVITGIETTATTYALDIETFMELATPVEKSITEE